MSLTPAALEMLLNLGLMSILPNDASFSFYVALHEWLICAAIHSLCWGGVEDLDFSAHQPVQSKGSRLRPNPMM